jgi:hypothetical protein
MVIHVFRRSTDCVADYSLDTIKSIMDSSMGFILYVRKLLNSCVVVHVGFIDDGAPFVLPMIGKMGQYENNPISMYVHGNTPIHSQSNMRLCLQSTYAPHEE